MRKRRATTFWIGIGLLGFAVGSLSSAGCGGSGGAAGNSGTAGRGGAAGTAGSAGGAAGAREARPAAREARREAAREARPAAREARPAAREARPEGEGAGSAGGAAGGPRGGTSGTAGRGGTGGTGGTIGGAGGRGGGGAGTAGGAGTTGAGGGAADAGVGASLTIDPKEATMFIGIGMPSPPVVFTVTNVGSAPSGSFTFTITGSSYFKITSNSCDRPLPGGESCQVSVVFDAPGGSGSRFASLNVVADGIPGGNSRSRWPATLSNQGSSQR